MQLLILFELSLGATLLTALLTMLTRTTAWGARPLIPVDPAFALLWGVGAACALAVVWLSKFHHCLSGATRRKCDVIYPIIDIKLFIAHNA
jgi:hypothetical protein